MPIYTIFMSSNAVLSSTRVAYFSLGEAIEAAKTTLRNLNAIIYDKIKRYDGANHWAVGRLRALPGEEHFVGDCVIVEFETHD